MSYLANGRPRGMGDYDRVNPWGWMYYPPPYGFANPEKPRPQSPPQFYAPAATMGLGCGCGGTCGGCGEHGMSGWFSSGLDVSGWGIGEWSVVSLGVIILGSGLMGTAHAGNKRRR